MPDADDKVLERFLEKRAARNAAGAEYRYYMRWAGKALEAPLSLVVGILLGSLVDGHFASGPYGLWFGGFTGVCAAARALYRIVKQYQAEHAEKAEKSEEKSEEEGS